MTGDEMAMRLHSQLGYLVYVSHCPHKVGDIRTDAIFEHDEVSFPLRVTGPATVVDLARQRTLQKQLAPAVGPPDWHSGKFFYFVEAAD